jgi:carbonic anhydrase
MDARFMVHQTLGLQAGDAHIIRNAGGIVTEDVLRSLIVSRQLVGIEEVMIVNHTDCGMLTFRDEELRVRLRDETGVDSDSPRRFHSFTDLEENVRRQIRRVQDHPWISGRVSVRGFVYDVQTGLLREVAA